MAVTVKAIYWTRYLQPVEGMVSTEGPTRTFKTRAAADLFVAAMQAADAKIVTRHTRNRTRVQYEIEETPPATGGPAA